jgi:hypothetical protein
LYNPANKNVKIVRGAASLGELKDILLNSQDIQQKLMSSYLKKEYNQKPEETSIKQSLSWG